MRVLHILCDLNGGGAERLVLDLCRHTAHQPDVVTVLRGGDLAPAFDKAGLSVRWAGRRRRRPGARAIAQIARWSTEYDIVHTHLWAGDLWGRLGARLGSRTPIVTTEHNARPDSSLRGLVWRQMAPLSDAIVCVSEAARQILIRDGLDPARLHVIHNGISLDRFSPLPPSTAPRRRVLAMGRLTRQKGLDVLLRAATLAPELELTILGDGPDRAALEPLARACGAAMPGWVADVRSHIAAADVVAVPSRWEGFGLVAAEAMACGRPVVASRVDGLAEVVGEAGVLVEPEDAAGLAAALWEVCVDEARWSRLREAGLRRAARFGVRRTAAAYDALYEQLTRR